MSNSTQAHVLLIEDDAADAERMQAALQSAGSVFDVKWVRSLGDALIRLRRRREGNWVDIILVDHNLPDGSGLTMLDQLLAASPMAIVIVVGCLNQQTDIDELIAHGAGQYFNKARIDTYWFPCVLEKMVEAQISLLLKKKAVEALCNEREFRRIALDAVSDAIVAMDVLGNITYINAVAETLTGWPQEEALGRPLLDVLQVINAITRESVPSPAALAIAQDQPEKLPPDALLIRQDGSECAIADAALPIHDCNGRLTGALVVFHDVSESRRLTLKMAQMAQHDYLTGLPNRFLLHERYSQAMGFARRNRAQLALLFIDVNFFKNINDSLGHALGDQLLQSVAQRLVYCVRETDTVCRQGGDEFVILLTQVEGKRNAALAVDKILGAFATPHIIGEHTIQVSISIGVSLYPSDGTSINTLLTKADSAMYCAKAKGTNSVHFYTADFDTPHVALAKPRVCRTAP